eukprot:TRINITY_DN51047_c0_g1_i1.p1 TRINITY_DN51047_c0_g1~~TRINITY_DN51047_c0_g1_i1.p1  ORF type:complete len:393 (-),score=69.58 TRINITY_DN51047_c0_g1_i1:19-1035(-)
MADDQIMEKLRELSSPGLGYRTLHSRLKEIPGFEEVGLKRVQNLTKQLHAEDQASVSKTTQKPTSSAASGYGKEVNRPAAGPKSAMQSLEDQMRAAGIDPDHFSKKAALPSKDVREKLKEVLECTKGADDEEARALRDVLKFHKDGAVVGSFGSIDYWEDRYKKEGKETAYDWYGGWPAMKPHVDKFMCSRDAPILNVGCGNSRLSQQLHDDGYTDVTNTDLAPSVIESMSEKCASLTGQRFLVDDITQMQFSDASFEVIIDKGTMDAIYNAGKDVAAKAVSELVRVLKPSGRLISVTYMHQQGRAELGAEEFGGSFETFLLSEHPQKHYVHVLTKRS